MDEFLCIDDIFAYKRCKEQCEECEHFGKPFVITSGYRKEVQENENKNKQIP
jgi:hypothetical protein